MLVHPEVSAIIFDRIWIQPWEAYLARYPQLAAVVIVGDDTRFSDHKIRHKRVMKTDALDGRKGWRRALTTSLHVRDGTPLACVVYERV